MGMFFTPPSRKPAVDINPNGHSPGSFCPRLFPSNGWAQQGLLEPDSPCHHMWDSFDVKPLGFSLGLSEHSQNYVAVRGSFSPFLLSPLLPQASNMHLSQKALLAYSCSLPLLPSQRFGNKLLALLNAVLASASRRTWSDTVGTCTELRK